MKLKFPILVFIFGFLTVYLLLSSLGIESKDNNGSRFYWLLIIIIAIPLLKILFPRLKKLGIGSAEFIPNLFKSLKK